MAVHRCRRCAGYPALATGRAAGQPLVGSALLFRALSFLGFWPSWLCYCTVNIIAPPMSVGSVQFCSALGFVHCGRQSRLSCDGVSRCRCIMSHVQGQESQEQDASCAITSCIVWCVVCGVNLVVNMCAFAFLSWLYGARDPAPAAARACCVQAPARRRVWGCGVWAGRHR